MMDDTRPFRAVFVEKRPLGYWNVYSTLFLEIDDDNPDAKDFRPLSAEIAADEAHAVNIAFRHCNYYKIPIANIMMHDEYSRFDGMFDEE